jgi:outer membrane protein assembly factor BamD
MKHSVPRIAAACLLTALAASPALAIRHKKTAKASDTDPLAGLTSKQPDKELFDKAMLAIKKGKYDIARLDLNTLLSTYPESEYQMRAKLAVGDSWYKEGGTAALQQAEAEYKDFITFFPNAPEAAEAQMKIGDIYYQQMEKPDRDPANAQRAEEEYRLMIQQYPDSTLLPRAKQRLRDVQEVLADRQYNIGAFYATHENWPATIARLQTVVDSYPLYSHSDMALLQLGDAYAGEALVAEKLNINKAVKERLIATYDDRAAECYDRVVTRYPMAPHVEDARERLLALGRSVPEPSQTAINESEAEEQTRSSIKLRDRALLLVKRGPNTITAARVGEPTMVTPPAITAPQVSKENIAIFNAAAAGKPAPASTLVTRAAGATPATGPSTFPTQDAAPVRLENVPEGGPGIGAEIISTGNNSSGTAETEVDNNSGNTSAGATPPSAKGESNRTPTPTPTETGPTTEPNNGGLHAVGPTNTAPLPPVQKPAEGQMQVNDVHGGNTAQVETGTTASATRKHKKNPKVKTNQNTESSSTTKKKKGLDKLNPF